MAEFGVAVLYCLVCSQASSGEKKLNSLIFCRKKTGVREGVRWGVGNAGINRYIRSTGFGGGCAVVLRRDSMWASRWGVFMSGILGVCL